MDRAYTLILSAAGSLLALAGCAATPATAGNPATLQLASLTETLDENARLLAARADSETAGFAADAHELEQHSYDLHEDAASGRANEAELRADFDKVTHSYAALQADVARINTQQTQADLDLVKDAYHDVASRMAPAPAAVSATPGS